MENNLIKIKNSQLNKEAIEILNGLLDKEINASCAFNLMKIIRTITPIIDDKIKLESKIMEKWVLRDEHGSVVKPTDAAGNIIEDAFKVKDIEMFNKEMFDFMDIEHTIEHNKIRFDDMGLDKVRAIDLLKVEFLFY